jgi:Bacterial protein of unknown function (DUF899)
MEPLERFEQINIRNDMADIVVCGDLEGEIEKSGELSKLKSLGSIEIFNELAGRTAGSREGSHKRRRRHCSRPPTAPNGRGGRCTPLIGERGAVTLLDVFEGRRMLIAYYFMWHTGHPAPEQCEGCTFFTSQVRELSHLHCRDVTYATFCQGPYEESVRYRDFMGWEMPWYSAQGSLDTLLVGRRVGMMHIVCYLRQRSNVFETYWTWMRGVEAMDDNYRLLDLTVYGR